MTGPARAGRKIGISGDTRPTVKLRDFFRNCDLLIYESTYGHDKYQKAVQNFHSTAERSSHAGTGIRGKKIVPYSFQYQI